MTELWTFHELLDNSAKGETNNGNELNWKVTQIKTELTIKRDDLKTRTKLLSYKSTGSNWNPKNTVVSIWTKLTLINVEIQLRTLNKVFKWTSFKTDYFKKGWKIYQSGTYKVGDSLTHQMYLQRFFFIILMINNFT